MIRIGMGTFGVGDLMRHEKSFRENPRMKLVLASLRKRDRSKYREDEHIHQRLKQLLASGELLTPQLLAG